jgi:hypothetical protein
MSNQAAIPPDENEEAAIFEREMSERRIFNKMLGRLLSVRHRVQLADGGFEDFSDLPEKFVPSAWVIRELPKELDELYRDLDDWYGEFDHTRVGRPKSGP